MPIDLTQLTSPTQAGLSKHCRPSYFYKTLTGVGKKSGVINDKVDTLKDYHANAVFNHLNNITFPLTETHPKLLRFATNSSDNAPSMHLPQEDMVYNLKKVHSISLSIWETMISNRLSYMWDVSYNEGALYTTPNQATDPVVPHAITDLPFQPVNLPDLKPDRTVSVSFLFPSMKYTQADCFEAQNHNSRVLDDYNLATELVFKFTQPSAQPDQTPTALMLSSMSNLKAEDLAGALAINAEVYLVVPLTDFDQGLIDRFTWSGFTNVVKYALEKTYASQSLDMVATMSAFDDVVNNLSVAETLTTQAQINDEHLLTDLVTVFARILQTQVQNGKVEPYKLSQVGQTYIVTLYYLLTLQDHNATDHDYQQLLTDLKALCDQYHITTEGFDLIVDGNTRLALSNYINTLATAPVHQFQPTIPKLPADAGRYSSEQLAIIETTKPYVVGVAGAGSGKSHTLLGRLKFLQLNQVDLKHVLVTSFTNVAAANITNRFGRSINSVTNAKLFHNIYQANFSHQLSNDLTLANSLRILIQTGALAPDSAMHDVAQELGKLMEASGQTHHRRVDPQRLTDKLLLLCQYHLNEVLELLDGLNQTCLILEPIILHTMMKDPQRQIKWPDEYQDLQFIVTDESQDTSAFEYIMILRLAAVNHAQLMIIGDANQTLYEFRNANPRFLNALERSDTFTAYTMSTNYRSRQAVLTYANQILSVLDTNATAKIQLHSNQYEKLTWPDFKDRVTLYNISPDASGRKDQQQQMKILTQTALKHRGFKDWVKAQIADHKQIAVMAFRNQDTKALADAVRYVWADVVGREPKLGYTRNDQSRANTWWSSTLAETSPSKDFMKLLKQHRPLKVEQVRQEYFGRLLRYKTRQVGPTSAVIGEVERKLLDNLLGNGTHGYARVYLNAYNRDFNADRFLGAMSMSLLRAENVHNAIIHQLDGKEQPDWHDSDIVVSTIHSAKGLEFDSTIVYFDENRQGAGSQANLRLYGVALTRAKTNELVLNNPKGSSTWTSGKASSFGHGLIDLTKTPMRTAYARVKNDLTNPDPSSSATAPTAD